MNAQLLDELPKLYKLSVEIFKDCIVCMITSQKKYLNRAIEEIYQLLSVNENVPWLLKWLCLSNESFYRVIYPRHDEFMWQCFS